MAEGARPLAALLILPVVAFWEEVHKIWCQKPGISISEKNNKFF